MTQFGGWNDVDPTAYPPLIYAETPATANTTTSSSTYTSLNAMSIVPTSGTHLLHFSTSSSNTGTGLGTISQEVFFSVFVNGVQIAHTERSITSVGGDRVGSSINCQVTVDGTETVEIRWRVSAGTGTCYQRTLNVLKLADV